MHCHSPVYFGSGRCNLNVKGKRGQNSGPDPYNTWLSVGGIARRAVLVPRQALADLFRSF